ncbi:uncharacterized protein AruCF_2966 [Achromobacter ruhlandii]|nr:uncharacterized protein AruCF_2966 [Achromobacter ruhlandii]
MARKQTGGAPSRPPGGRGWDRRLGRGGERRGVGDDGLPGGPYRWRRAA